eukprot:3774172-Rhodomonas_salina.2
MSPNDSGSRASVELPVTLRSVKLASLPMVLGSRVRVLSEAEMVVRARSSQMKSGSSSNLLPSMWSEWSTVMVCIESGKSDSWLDRSESTVSTERCPIWRGKCCSELWSRCSDSSRRPGDDSSSG